VIYAFMRAAVRALALVILGRRLRIDGMQNIPRRGAVLVVGNHVGTLEPPLTGVHIPRRDVYYMAKSELFKNRLMGWLFERSHTFAVVRESADRAALRRALDILHKGHVLLVYPEGTRSWEGGVGEPHAGAGFIAKHSKALIVPVAGWGSENVVPRGKWLPRRADVHLRIGEGFRLPERGADGKQLTNREASRLMMTRVAELLPGHPFLGRDDTATDRSPAA
jgi:1-acyl-sn-glycerol-3-phosphate acyltransferase